MTELTRTVSKTVRDEDRVVARVSVDVTVETMHSQHDIRAVNLMDSLEDVITPVVEEASHDE